MAAAMQSEAEFQLAALACLDGLYGYAMSLLHNQAEAEDLVQETYLKAIRSFRQLAPDSNVKGWLYAIARNTWLNQLRHARSGPQFVEIDDEEREDAASAVRSSDDPHTSYISKLEQASVRAAILQLPLVYRELILLREFEELSYQQIAEILKCPIGTVMSRLDRARKKLRVLLSGSDERAAMTDQ